jgi:hypothetical protein
MSPGEEDVRASEGVWRPNRCLCTGGRVSPGEEDVYVCRGACVAQRRRRLCVVRRMKLRCEYGKPASRRTQGLGGEC